MHQNKKWIAAGIFFAFLAGCTDQIPPKLLELWNSKEPVRTYEKFSDINPITPVPGKLEIGFGALAKILLTGKQQLPFSILPPSQYNQMEKDVLRFFTYPGLQKSLKLLSYARQLKENHPYRINPFVSFLTVRPENQMLSDQKVGPAALVMPILHQKGPFVGQFTWRDSTGTPLTFDVSISPSSLPTSGSMLLFDHQLFPISDLLSNPSQNVLQDVIVHEFTHIWNNELLSPNARINSTVESKKTESGHDTMIVSNPELAFTEGLAESFEALYGGTSSQLANMTKTERGQFYGKLHSDLKEALDFLINRQVYIRENSYLYNLYDFGKCSLRLIDAIDSRDHDGTTVKFDELIARLARGEKISTEELLKYTRGIDFAGFQKRFYGKENRVSTLTLRQLCQEDSPGRLESKEGFLASLFYGLLTSGALTGDALERPARDTASTETKASRWQHFRRLATDGMEPVPVERNYLEQGPARAVAAQPSHQNRLGLLERNFLIGFRNLATGIAQSDATRFDQLMKWYFSGSSLFNRDEQIRLAFFYMVWTHGAFFQPETPADRALIGWMANSKSTRKNLEAIYQRLDQLYQAKDLDRVLAKMGQVPAVYVEYKSLLRGNTNKRINVNLAYHVDLIDMFGKNSKELTEVADNLDRGEYFQSEADFLDFARSIDAEARVRPMLEKARASILDNEKLRKQIGLDALAGSSALRHEERTHP